ncbi:MAG: SpoIID/LytB domain-containing protein [Acidobacteria bacterium]|nr:SpoIID/LytB domain-containing protein [Acidobacteriota bacterium]
MTAVAAAALFAAVVMAARLDGAQVPSPLLAPQQRSTFSLRANLPLHPRPPQSFRASSGAAALQAPRPPDGVAYFVRNLTNPRERSEARGAVLDTPVLPGSVMKVITLVAALESGVITPDTSAMCRRVVTIDDVRYVCAHPDLKRPLTPAEALAHSCNDFFVSLAPRLPRDRVNRTRMAAGLPPLGASTPLAAALVGLDGPRVTPRSLIDMLARVAGVGPDTAVPMRADTRSVVMAGLTGAATYGTASAFGEAATTALAKTGTAPMPGGGVAGLVVALSPAIAPTHGVVVLAPGAAGVDAAAVAADVLRGRVAPSASASSASSVSSARATPTQVAPSSTPAPPVVVSAPIALGRTLPDGRTRVEQIAMDDYVAQVLAGEGQPAAADAAQQALAIVARTFAEANRQRHRREGFDLCDTTHCQVVRAATATTRRAAVATTGRILVDGGRAATIFYSANCGGRLERASDVWPGAPDHGHPATDDVHGEEAPWESEVRVGDVERALRAAGLRGSRLRDLRVLERNASGRVARLRVDGFTPGDISGNDFRLAIGRVGGWQLVRSTAFDVQRVGVGYRFRGRGFGHGVGLCVVGAGTRAARGASTDDILRFYFPRIAVSGVSDTLRTDASAVVAPAAPVQPPSVAPPSRAAAADVQLALPASEEGERTAVIAIVRRSRDQIARATGQPAPAALRVTVHPTVEAFGRATGRPWWVAGASSGTTIDLLPITLLRQRGIVEQTIGHEIAHVLVDQTLATRPMWVREGAAIHFSRPTNSAVAAPASSARVACPTDAELLRPVSAGAQRDAYERADACFAKAVARTSWQNVK